MSILDYPREVDIVRVTTDEQFQQAMEIRRRATARS
jgi:hypothetical protein